MNNKIKITFEIGFCLFGIILLSSLISAAIGTSFCCENTLSQGWCQNILEANVATQCITSDGSSTPFLVTPTGCDSTFNCKKGTCLNNEEGICIENTPKRVCENDGGYWKEGTADTIPQCQLGCCLIGNQAAFVTKVRCNVLSSLYGLNIDFREDITSETTCIQSAKPDVKGACVYEGDFLKNCQMLTKKECETLKTGGQYDNVQFNEEYLCTASALNTECNPTSKTTCIDGKDEVYFLDSCGNIANIYDITKDPEELGVDNAKNDPYWTKIVPKSESCDETTAGTSDGACGNCNYYFGSTCRDVKGDNVCVDLNCNEDVNDDGVKETMRHGESWCANSENYAIDNLGVKKIDVSSGEISTTIVDAESYKTFNTPGSRYFRMLCYNGEVMVEPCADYRQEICIEAETELSGGEVFKSARCRTNRWDDCVTQTNQEDCENQAMRDCYWLFGSGQNTKISCVPMFAPGFKFWSEEDNGEDTCNLADDSCSSTQKKKIWNVLFRSGDVGMTGDQCYNSKNDGSTEIRQEWLDNRRLAAGFLGDCMGGGKANYQNELGSTETGYGKDYQTTDKDRWDVGF
jgi:hypothetical protein